MNVRYVVLWATLGVFFGLDRIAKLWALHACEQPMALTSWCHCDLVMNRGVSFGLFHSQEWIMFAAVTVLVMGIMALVACRAYVRSREGFSIAGELFILVGAFSNLIDRFMYDGVIDFMVLTCRFGTWPAYNLADAMIVGGAIYLLITSSQEVVRS
jgi:signal peptidase II